MNFATLIAVRDKLNLDIGVLIAAGSAPQTTIDTLAATMQSADAAVMAASTPIPPPPPPPPGLSFVAFSAAAAAFAVDAKLTQAQIDAATAALVAATI